MLNVALPAIGRAFQAGTAEVQWVINAFMLPLSALLLLGGAAGDLYGRRRVMLVGIALFTAASVLCAAAPSLAVFLAGRALQGLGAAMLMPNSLAILSAAFTGEAARPRGRHLGGGRGDRRRARADARRLAGRRASAGRSSSSSTCRSPPARSLLGWLFVPESENDERPPPDWAGALLATLGLGALTWGLTAWSASDRLDTAAAAAIGAGAGAACSPSCASSGGAAARRWCRSPCSARAPSSA